MPIKIFIGTDEDFRRGDGRLALTTTEVLAHLKLQNIRFRQLMDQGEITPFEERLGNYQLFDAAEVEALRQKRLKRF